MKKIIALIIMLILSTQAVLASPPDVVNTAYNKQVNFLMQLKIIRGFPDGTFRPEEPITRSEISTLIIKALNMEDVIGNIDSKPYFNDVDKDYWAYGYIQLAKDLNIIDGYPEGNFHPDEKITYEQTVKIVVCALGYGKVALENAPYPDGYLQTAYNIGLLKNINASKGMNRGVAAQIIYNSLFIKRLEHKADGQYEISSTTLLDDIEKHFDIQERRGIVTGVGISNLNSHKKLKDYEIEINGIVYNAGEINTDGLLGKYVSYYANDADGLLFSINQEKNTELKIDYDLIDKENLVLPYISYFAPDKQDKITRIEVEADAPVLLNNKRMDGYSSQDLKINNGNLLLIDNDDDNVYDVIFINTYITLMSDGVDLEQGRIKLKSYSDKAKFTFLGKTYIDCNDKNTIVSIVDISGKEYPLKDIKPDQILCVFASQDGEYVKVVVLDKTVEGSVTEAGAYDNEPYVVIDGKQYKWAKEAVDISLDDKGRFWLDYNDRVTAKSVESFENEFVSTINDVVYGYLIDIQNTGSALNEDIKLKMLLQYKEGSQKVEIFNLTKTVLFNGESKKPSDILKLLSPNQPINFKLNSNREISKIKTLDDLLISDTNYMRYYEDTKSFDNLYYITDTALTFFANVDKDDENYATPLKLTNGTLYQLKVYDLTDIKDGKPIWDRIYVITSSYKYATRTLPNVDSPGVVEKITSFLDSDGNTANKLYIAVNGEVASFPVKTELNSMISTLSFGSVIRFSTNSSGEIYDFEEITQLPPSAFYRAGVGGTKEQAYGTVIDKKTNNDNSSAIVKIAYDVGEQYKEVSYEIGQAPVYILRDTRHIGIGTVDDIIPLQESSSKASKIFIFTVNLKVKFVVVLS